MNTAATVRADFGAHLYDRLARTQSGKNLFLSPFSIQVSLAMIAAAAKAETRKVLAELIGASEGVDEQNRQYAEWISAIHGNKEGQVQLATANALWGQQGYRFNAEYKKVVADFYEGVFNEVNFQSVPDQIVKTINRWVEDKTDGKIKDLVKHDLVTADTRLILTNAIYFEGKWGNEFDKSDTLNEDWYGFKGEHKVPMMQQRRGFHYYENDEFQALDLPYQGQQLSMLVLLPRKKNGLTALESKWIEANTYRQVTDSLAYESMVIVSLPRFKIEAEFMLKPVLCNLGAELAFTDKADFSGLGEGPLKIAEVIHKTFIEVNEEGTEAAGATGVVTAKGGSRNQPKVFLADHPFLFFIRHKNTNAMLFCGRLIEPN